MTELTGESLNVQHDQLEKLKQLFPEAIAEGKIDWEKLQATLGKENIEFHNERYVLNWAGKTDAFKVLQQSTTATLKPAPEESINFDTTDNIFIEGENLGVLKVLQKSYYGKIKCIIIDPPYNTGNDSFIYPDSFKESKEDYQKRIGEKDEDGYLLKEGFFRKNGKDSGHYHSNWLSMMYPRLFLAKNLLRDDGVIFIHIDDNEVHNLRLIMNEIFGEENFVGQWNWFKSKTPPNLSTKIKKNIEFIIGYEKSRSNLRYKGLKKESKSDDPFTKPQNSIKELKFKPNSININRAETEGTIKSGVYGTDKYPNELLDDLKYSNGQNINEIRFKNRFVWTQQKLDEELEKSATINLSINGVLSYKKAEYQPEVPPNFIESEIGDTTENAGRYLTELLGGNYFDYPKPVSLIKYVLDFCVNKNDTILDFFGGSGTTAQAVLELNKEDGGNRKFILVQLPEKCDEESEAYKAGYKTIADISKERIRRAIKKIEKKKKENKNLLSEIEENKNLDLGFKVFKLSTSNFKIWRGNEITEENLEQQLDAFINPVREGSEKENMLYELILKAGYLLTDKMEEKNKYFSIKDGELIIALEEMNQKLIDKIISVKPNKVITLDKLFTVKDQLKTNAVLQMRDAEIDFKTI